MFFRMRKPATALAMMLTGAALAAQALPELPPAQLQTLTRNQAARVAQALAHVRGQAPSLGLTAADDLMVRSAFTNPQGECVVRFDQINQNTRVVGASLVAKVRPDGTVVLGSSSLVTGVSLPSTENQLTPAQALALLVAKLSPTVGFNRTPSVEAVVFPTRLMGDLVLTKDLATGLLAMDPLRSAELYTPSVPHLRGYRIICDMQSTQAQPDVTLTVIMDAQTGAILDRSFTGPKATNPYDYAQGYHPIAAKNKLQAAAMKAKAQADTATTTTTPFTPGVPSALLVPTVGWANTPYSGLVALPTTFDPALKGYGLLDTTRGTANNFFVQDRMGYSDAYGNYHFNLERPAGNIVVNDQFGTFVPYTMDGLSGSEQQVAAAAAGFVTGRPATTGTLLKDDVWGNSGDFVPTTDPTTAYGSFGPEGMADAAEAMNTMTNAYEFMKYEFNLLGLDGNDTGMTVVANDGYYVGECAHQTFGYSHTSTDPKTAPAPYPEFAIWAGTGIYSEGMATTAEPTLLGQQIGEMLWEWHIGQNTSSLYENKFLERSFGNIMSQGIMSLGALHGLQRTIIQAPYEIGMNWYNGSYDVSMFQPNLDGISPNGWFDGIAFLANDASDYGDGPLNRAYFYMAQYASSTATDPTYSTYLPKGMTGIGLEKTVKILFKALTEDLTNPHASMHDMRAAAIQAASDLYGAGSAEVMATTNAFAAVNVGGAYGQPDPVMVQFNMANYPADSDMGINSPFEANPRGNKYPLVPMGEPTQLKVDVIGTADTSLTWTNNPALYSGAGLLPLDGLQQGSITPGGVFTSSLNQGASSTINSFSVQATSHADPNQWAQGFVMSLAMDYDGDGTNDALDLGYLALAYELGAQLTDSVNAHIMSGFPGVGEGELQMNLAAFKTAFNK